MGLMRYLSRRLSNCGDKIGMSYLADGQQNKAVGTDRRVFLGGRMEYGNRAMNEVLSHP